MRETALFSLFGLPVTAYAVCLVFAAVLSIGTMLLTCKKEHREELMLFSVLAVPLSLLSARILYCLVNMDLYLYEPCGAVFRLWDGGFAICGAIGGACLAALLTARLRHVRFTAIADQAAPSGALMIALGRFAEFFSGEGYGAEIGSENLCFFPLAVRNEYDEWRLAVFVLEGLYALIMLFILLKRKSAGKTGQAAVMLILYCSGQVLLENIRWDEYLNWVFGYLRVSQLICAVTMLSMTIYGCVKNKRRDTAGQILLYLFFAGITVGAQFAMDKLWWMPNSVCYGLVALSAVGFGTIAFRCLLGKNRAEKR